MSVFRESDSTRRAIPLVAICLIITVGCHRDRSEENAQDHHEHVGHIIPAHKPKNFPEAIVRLRELSREIQTKVSEGKSRALLDDKTLSVAFDIANWLPEIAADSDLPKEPWDAVSDCSKTLVVDYQKLLDAAAVGTSAADSNSAAGEADRTISDLEAILARADPRWFDGPPKRRASP
jgi:hypothetical protein